MKRKTPAKPRTAPVSDASQPRDAEPPSEIEALQAQLRARDELLGQVCATLDSLRVAILKRYGA